MEFEVERARYEFNFDELRSKLVNVVMVKDDVESEVVFLRC